MHRYNLFGTPAKSRGFQMSKSKQRSRRALALTLRCFRGLERPVWEAGKELQAAA